MDWIHTGGNSLGHSWPGSTGHEEDLHTPQIPWFWTSTLDSVWRHTWDTSVLRGIWLLFWGYSQSIRKLPNRQVKNVVFSYHFGEIFTCFSHRSNKRKWLYFGKGKKQTIPRADDYGCGSCWWLCYWQIHPPRPNHCWIVWNRQQVA